jgi:hypothetical protein
MTNFYMQFYNADKSKWLKQMTEKAGVWVTTNYYKKTKGNKILEDLKVGDWLHKMQQGMAMYNFRKQSWPLFHFYFPDITVFLVNKPNVTNT